jgi:hypothetical protein
MDHSCRDAVARLITWPVARGLRPCAADTGGYCTARDALPETACRQLVRHAGSDLEREAPAEWLWHERRVRVVDGAAITMPDNSRVQQPPRFQKPRGAKDNSSAIYRGVRMREIGQVPLGTTDVASRQWIQARSHFGLPILDGDFQSKIPKSKIVPFNRATSVTNTTKVTRVSRLPWEKGEKSEKGESEKGS